MGNLTKERVIQNYSCNCLGVASTLHFHIKQKYQCKGIYHKIYEALFICFVTRVINLKIVIELTSQVFIEILKSFFYDVAYLFSSNAQNVTGSNKELKRLNNIVRITDDNLSVYFWLWSR